MQWWVDLTVRGKAMLATVAALGAALAALQGPLEPVTPVWRGWVREYVSDLVTEAIKPLTLQLSVVNESQLENRISVFGLNLTILRGELTDLSLRLRDRANDPIASRRLNEVQAAISQLESLRSEAQCQLDLTRGTRASC